ncbi:family 10 glycosylhydrolase, partial [Thermogutta sp.]|uniref:family 10 glycosylhydrolase n=1 Tax=Thermogutta sp. TaxID=1962930 RepID=UPI003C7AC23E
MFGQGGPRLPVLFPPLARRRAALASILLHTVSLGLAVLVCSFSSAHGETLGLRISWGGGTPRRWSGTITVSEGQIVSWTLLGTEVDEPGALFREENTLVIAPSRPRIYQGVDLLVDSPIQANLQIELAIPEQAPQRWTIPLKNILRDPYEAPVDDQGNQLFVERSPGDSLAIETDRPHLIFEPGETWSFRVRFRGSPFNSGEQVTLMIRVQNARQEQQARWNLLDPFNLGRSNGPGLPSARYETTANPNTALPVEVRLPEREGVYDVVLTAAASTGLRLGEPVVRPLGWGSPTVQRRVQVVVLAKENSPSLTEARPELRLLGEAVDAGNPTFWERLSRITPALPPLHLLPRDGLLGRGWRRLREGQLEPYTELQPSKPGEEPSWAIYSLPIMEPGTPHVLEIEWPADRKQTLLVSLVEPNAMGAISPPLLDIGVTSSGELSRWGEKVGWQVYRAVFWPKTRQPFLMVANPGSEPAIYGRIRVYGGWRHLPEYFPPAAFPTERVLAAYFHRPFLAATFQASDALGPFRERGVEDWVTFYDAITRLSEYLRFAGYSAVVLTVAADGSTLFPSPRWQPTPRYDNGCFHPDGADPVRKDVVELLLRVADRDGFMVIPAMDFSTPLPDLEAMIHRRGNQGRNLRWVGPDGRTLDETTQPYRGMLPYYNILHREVQESILNLIHEFADRYGQHPSLAGLGLQVSAYGYMQLPGPQWGMDDETVARFCEETGITIEATGDDRYQKRAELLLGQYLRHWVRWRAQRLQSFYTRVNQELTAVRPDARLYLLAPTLFVGERWENRLRPTLIQRQ